MFSFVKRQEYAGRGALKADFDKTVSYLESADATVQVAVGHAINLANTFFHKAYTVASFQALPMQDRVVYIHKLNSMQVKLRDEAQDPVSSVGFGLFKMWVAAIAANDEELADNIASVLAHYSHRGDLSALEGAL